MSNQISCPLALSTSPSCPGPTVRAHTHTHMHAHIIHIHTCPHNTSSYTCTQACLYILIHANTHMHNLCIQLTCHTLTPIHMLTHIQAHTTHTYTNTKHSYTCAHTEHTCTCIQHAYTRTHITHISSCSLTWGPKSASRPFDASSPTSHFLDQPLSSGQEQRQPDRLLLSCSGRCSAHITLGNYGLRPSVKPEEEVGDPGVSLWPMPYPPPKRTIL